MRRTTRRSVRTLAATGATVGLALLVAAPTGAAESAESRGAGLLQAVEGGQSSCADLTAADFEAIGEFAMGRMLGSPQAHESMDQLAIQMMGPGGLERMHQVMGQRFAACGQPAFPGGFAQMMAMMPGMGGTIGSHGGGPMGEKVVGPGDQTDGGETVGPGSMVGSDLESGGRQSGDDDGSVASMAAAMLILILGAGGLVYFLVRRRPHPGGALQVLAGRFAAGELSAGEYAQRRHLLEGSRK